MTPAEGQPPPERPGRSGAEPPATGRSYAPPDEPEAPSGPPRPFRPSPLLTGPHAQTVAGRLLRAFEDTPYRRERMPTPDGDFLDLDHAPAGDGTAGPGGRPAVVVLHGLGGSSEAGYVRATCRRLSEAGMDAVALNFRSCGGEPNRLRRFYHSGETGDLGLVVDRLRRRRPRSPLGAVGFSLGGNVLLKYLGERGRDAVRDLDAAVAVSVPYDLGASADRMEGTLAGRLYTAFFLRSLRRSVRAKARLHGHGYDLDAVRRARTLREFDDAFTAPVHGFEDAEDYYRRSSSAGFLPDVRVPTLLLHARDDPFLPEEALPEERIRRNRSLTASFPERGGHLGFVERARPRSPGLWAEREAARFLASALLDVPPWTDDRRGPAAARPPAREGPEGPARGRDG